MFVPEQQEQGYKISELSSASERTIKWSYTYSPSPCSLTSQIILVLQLNLSVLFLSVAHVKWPVYSPSSLPYNL